MNNYLLTVGIALLLITVCLCGCNETSQDTDGDTNNIENYNPFYCKKVILRADDISNPDHLPSLSWIANLTINNDMKLTFAVIPASITYNVETAEYLNQLDKGYFEFAAHGYKHTEFKGLPYEEQYNLIENATRAVEEYLHYKPFTFIPPYDSSDVNTTKALSALGYHSITNMKDHPCYVVDFISDIEYETGWDTPPPEHRSVEEFTNSFDEFYDSSDDYYIIVLHDWTFLDEEGNLNETRTHRFEEIIDYIRSKHVQFMTIEEAYQMRIDEDVIKTGMINESGYFIDLQNCSYNHTIKINPPSSWKGTVYLVNDTTGEETVLDDTIDEFDGIKGHFFYLNHIE